MNLNLTSLKSALLLLAIFTLTTFWAHAQQPVIVATERDRGVTLYQQGDAKGAIDALRLAVKRDKNDMPGWHYLGLALELKGNKGGAKKAHEKASRLGEDLLDRQLARTASGADVPRALLAVRSQL